MNGFICGPRRYQFQGLTIEESSIGGPCVVKPNGDIYMRLTKKQAATLLDFYRLSDEKRASYRTGGGCIQI